MSGHSPFPLYSGGIFSLEPPHHCTTYLQVGYTQVVVGVLNISSNMLMLTRYRLGAPMPVK